MVSDKKVFPTKDSWVSLARKPIIPDNKELEKVFKLHNICLLNLPPAEKKASQRSRSGNMGMLPYTFSLSPMTDNQQKWKQALFFTKTASTVLRDAEPVFNERDRALFLEICGIPQLSKSVRAEPQTESLRPCPSMQALVGTMVPYIQRFLYHHDELSEVYSELFRNNIREKIKQLSFAQVRISQIVENRLEWECVCLFHLEHPITLNVNPVLVVERCWSCTSATSSATASW